MNSSQRPAHVSRLAMILFLTIPYSMPGQVNFLSKYAGSYYVLPFGTDQPTAASEQIILTGDGKWSSISYPIDENDIPSKVAVRKQGTWKAADGVLQILHTNGGNTQVTEYKLDVGLFISQDTYLDPIFISAPMYLKKYAGSYYVLHENLDRPAAYTRTVKLTGDGTCTILTPVVDESGVTEKPIVEKSVWKAREATLQLFLREDEENKPTLFEWRDQAFHSGNGYYLKKVPPPPPPNPYFKTYAGTYFMLVDGHPQTVESDKYEFFANGKATWTIYVRANADGTVSKEPFTRHGTWQPSAGRIVFHFQIEDFDMGDIPTSDFRMVNGVFRWENIYLKKAEAPKTGK